MAPYWNLREFYKFLWSNFGSLFRDLEVFFWYQMILHDLWKLWNISRISFIGFFSIKSIRFWVKINVKSVWRHVFEGLFHVSQAIFMLFLQQTRNFRYCKSRKEPAKQFQPIRILKNWRMAEIYPLEEY